MEIPQGLRQYLQNCIKIFDKRQICVPTDICVTYLIG